MAQVWNIRTVNGSALPIPKSLEIDRLVLDLESYRSASGLLIRNPLATKKHKIILEFPPMNKTNLQALLTQLDHNTLVVTYENIITSAIVTGNFYPTDFAIKPIWIKNEANTDVIHDVFAINLIEY